jgi:flagellum-specific ATP synthase
VIPLETVCGDRIAAGFSGLAMIDFAALVAEIQQARSLRCFGRVTGTHGGLVAVAGLSRLARVGDRIRLPDGQEGEILHLEREDARVLLDGAAEGLAVDMPVQHLGPGDLAPDDAWIGRVIDPFGQPLDGRPLARGAVVRPLRAPPPAPARRKRMGGRLATGLDVFDTILPIVRGQRIGLFAGSGVGKTQLLGQLARHVPTDVVVLALVGERGRELRDFVEDVLGPEGMARTVVVAATSDRGALVRRRAAWTAMSVAEHFRDQGRQVLLLCDSVTRFAEAHREVALAGGEPASLRGFPPSMAGQVMALAERAGPGESGAGDITAIFTVLVAGSDMEEPVADVLRGVLDGHVVLERAIAERGRFPAVDVLRSVSRSLPGCATPGENAWITEARRLLGAYERAEMMVQAGLYATGSDPLVDRAVRLWPKLDAFVAGRGDGVRAAFGRLQAILEGP